MVAKKQKEAVADSPDNDYDEVADTFDEAMEEEEEEEEQGEDMEEDTDRLTSTDKVEIIAGASSDQTAMTFCFKEEDHTIGNSLRHMINKNPQVNFCGYSIPHPSEAKLNLRIQTTGQTTAVEALTKGLNDLNDMCAHIHKTYQEALAKEEYDVWEETA